LGQRAPKPKSRGWALPEGRHVNLLKVTKAVDWLSDMFGFIAKWLVLLACLVSAGNAMIRYLFNY
jgi:TRAP-type mannitol/chloroaromatic compound transport system permease small subunit